MSAQSLPADWPNREASACQEVAPHRWHVQEAGTGPRILLLHGAGGATHSWRDVFPILTEAAHVLAPDLPGQGFTRLGSRSRCGLEAMSTDIAALLAAREFAPDLIVGHAAGGALALRLALDQPPPAGIVGINAALSRPGGPAAWLFPVLAKTLALTPLIARAVAGTATRSHVARLLAGTGSRIDAAGIGHYTRLLRSRPHVDATLAMMAQWDLQRLMAELESVSVPVMFLLGGRDRAVPPAGIDTAARRMPAAQTQMFETAGHLLHEEMPEAVAQLILARCRAG